MMELGGHPNVILELSNPQESNRRVSDNRGRFSFAGIRPGHWTLRILDGNLPESYYIDKDTYEYDLAPGQSVEQTFKVLPRKRRIQIIAQGKTIEIAPAKGKAAPAAQEKVKKVEPAPQKQKPVEVAPPRKSLVETAPKVVVQKPAIIPSAPSVKPEQVQCTVAFVPERLVFVIEFSTWSTKALADSDAAHIAKMADLPAIVQMKVAENNRASYVVILGSFKTRKDAEEACERIQNLR
jgi:cell division protein FtsN